MAGVKVWVELNPELWQLDAHTDGALVFKKGEKVEITADEFERISKHTLLFGSVRSDKGDAVPRELQTIVKTDAPAREQVATQ